MANSLEHRMGNHTHPIGRMTETNRRRRTIKKIITTLAKHARTVWKDKEEIRLDKQAGLREVLYGYIE